MSERIASVKREYGFVLLAGAVGAGLVILAVRQQWARAVFTPAKPLAPEVVGVSGSDLVPLAGALALAALAGLAAVIATRGVLRRVAGVLLALFGAGAGAAVLTSVTAATVLSVAASKVASPGSAAYSGTAPGSTTSGSTGTGGFVVSGSAGQAVMTGASWHVAVLLGALLIFAAGLATVLRGADWPVMSARYDAPGTPRGRAAGGADGARPGAPDVPGGPERVLDAATMWESLNGGEDPTEDDSGAASAEDARTPGDAGASRR
ncbi:MAG TPA: Trp biosynthesis-associated membrane protein [Trebonia sp.]|nr:Trp biosynthesis-associated membrane protein [Trebonia sp.]